MTTRYSRTTGTFYPFDVQYNVLPSDLIEVSIEDYQKAMSRPANHTFDFIDGQLVISAPPPLSAAELEQQKIKIIESAVQQHLDATAQALGYDNSLSTASYASLPAGEPYQEEAVRFSVWRARVWEKCYALLNACKEEGKPVLAFDEIKAQLPVWPPKMKAVRKYWFFGK